MDQEKENEDHLEYLGKPMSDINSLRKIFSEKELTIINNVCDEVHVSTRTHDGSRILGVHIGVHDSE